MSYDWYKIINRAEFLASGLVQKELDLVFEGVGSVQVIVTSGFRVSLVYEGALLSIGVIDDDVAAFNPYEFGGYAVYVNSADDIFLGINPQ